MKKGRLPVQIALILFFCGLGVFLVYLPSIPGTRLEKKEPGSIKITPQGIRKALTTVNDPEIDLNIVELGLIRDIEIKKDKSVVITIVFTSPFCPLADFIVRQIEKKIGGLEGVGEVDVKIDQSVIWDWDMMTEEGKQKLKGYLQ